MIHPRHAHHASLARAQKSTTKFGNEHEAFAVYHMMKGVQRFCPIYTLCVGNAFGEAALLLSAGTPVRRCATLFAILQRVPEGSAPAVSCGLCSDAAADAALAAQRRGGAGLRALTFSLARKHS
jgi:hypothetical protein